MDEERRKMIAEKGLQELRAYFSEETKKNPHLAFKLIQIEKNIFTYLKTNKQLQLSTIMANSVFTQKEGYGVVSRSITLNTQQSLALGMRLETLGFVRKYLEELQTAYSDKFVTPDGTSVSKDVAFAHLDDLGNLLSHLAEAPTISEEDMFSPRYEGCTAPV